MTKTLRRVDDIGEPIATGTTTCRLKAEYYREGRNVISSSGTIGSVATTGKVYSLASTESFVLKPKR